jgi:zinc/manganese transport system substrate-binding protein
VCVVLRFGVVLALAGCVLAPGAPVLAQSACSFRGGFAQLQAHLPERVGACLADARYRPEIGESFQPTTNGALVWHSVDNAISFSDTFHTWVLDPNAQVQVRNVNERFAFEFNGDGLPLVGQPAPNTTGPCPTAPVAVLAVENFYASLVQQLGGQCVTLTTILADPDADPHEFQPTAGDVRAFHAAALVVEDGLGYDDFADKALGTLSRQPAVVRAGDVVGLQVGANSHIWYSAGYVDQVMSAITDKLKQVNPDAGAYYDAQATASAQALGTYHQLISQISAQFGDVPVGATESIFVDMAYSTRLKLITPPAFMTALSEGNDPSAQDIAEFQNQINNKQIKVLVYNVQTVTPITEQLKQLAVQNNIPVVGRRPGGWRPVDLCPDGPTGGGCPARHRPAEPGHWPGGGPGRGVRLGGPAGRLLRTVSAELVHHRFRVLRFSGYAHRAQCPATGILRAI